MMKRIQGASFFGLAIILAGCAVGGGKQANLKSEPLDEKATVHYDFAFDAYRNGELIPALGEAMKTVELAPNNASAHNLLGLILFRQAKFTEAEVSFKRSGELDPRMAEAFNNLGSLYLAQKKFEDARLALIRAQENPLYLYPERIQNNLGLAYLGLQNKPDAEAAFRVAVQYRKDFYLPHMNLGRMLFEDGRLKESRESLETAAKLCKDCAEPQFYLGQAYLKLNKPEEAHEFFKKGVELDPQGSFGRLCQEQLASKN